MYTDNKEIEIFFYTLLYFYYDMFNYKMAEITKILEKTNLDELSPKDALDVLYRLKEKLNYDGITFSQNNGLGQEVKHYHLHLIPRYNKEEKLSVEEVYNKIK